MRVTNEQVQKICTTSYNFRDQVTGVTTVDIATDLIDAREFIEKQEAIIKEMRRFIARIGIYQLDDIDVVDRMSCLEKTKDYAE